MSLDTVLNHSAYVNIMGCIDLRKSPAAETLEHFFDGIAQGNEGKAELVILDWCPPKELKMYVRIRHRHVVSGIIIYDLTTYLDATIDPLDPNAGNIQFYVDTPSGKVRITLREIANILSQLVQSIPQVSPVSANKFMTLTSESKKTEFFDLACVDFRNTQVAATLQTFFSGLAQGNEGSAEVTTLEWCPPVDLKAHVKVRHRHVVWGVPVYDVTMEADFDFNPRDPNATGVKFCIGSPVGDICITLNAETLGLLAGLLPLA